VPLRVLAKTIYGESLAKKQRAWKQHSTLEATPKPLQDKRRTLPCINAISACATRTAAIGQR